MAKPKQVVPEQETRKHRLSFTDFCQFIFCPTLLCRRSVYTPVTHTGN